MVALRERKKRLIRAKRPLPLPLIVDLVGDAVVAMILVAIEAAARVIGDRAGGRVVAVEDVDRPDDERRNGLGFVGT